MRYRSGKWMVELCDNCGAFEGRERVSSKGASYPVRPSPRVHETVKVRQATEADYHAFKRLAGVKPVVGDDAKDQLVKSPRMRRLVNGGTTDLPIRRKRWV